MSIDLYSPRSMAQALLQMKPPKTFLRTMCVRRDEFFNSEQVDVDIKIGARRLAPFVNPNKGMSKVMDRIGFSTQTYTAPMISPKRPITVSDLQKRMPGENIYAAQSPDERAAMLLGQDLSELDEDITRVEEWMVAQAAFNSSIHVKGDDVDYTITFPKSAVVSAVAPTGSPVNGLRAVAPATTQLATAKCWDQSGADIIGDIRAMRRAFVKQTGVTPDFIVGDGSAMDVLLNAPSLNGLTGLLNTRRLDLGLISPELRDGGATYYGQFAGTGIDIWAYDEWYIDPTDGSEKPLLPAKTILMGSSKAYAVMRYGAVGVTSGMDGQAQLSLVSGRRIPESWINKEPAVRFLKVSSRPLFVPVQNDAFLTCQVLA